MLFRCLLLLFCIIAISAQKGGRKGSASEVSPVQRSPSRALAARKLPQPSEEIQQVSEPDRDPDPSEDRDTVSGVRPSRPRPGPRPQPQPSEGEGEGHEPAPEPYSFSYAVEDPETGAASTREETQDANGEIVGFYHIKDAEGRMRRVDYTAGKDGFKATIKSNEEGLNSRAPADVKVELSASPSETIQTYASNNRPIASESSLKSYGRPTQSKFYQKLIPTSTTRLPPPPPPPPQSIEQTQDTENYESLSDPQITQQRNVDEEEQPYESAAKGGPTPSRPSTEAINVQGFTARPVLRPTGSFTPVRTQTFREQGSVNLQPIRIEPQIQYKEDIPNSIQEIQQTLEGSAPAPPSPPASTKTIPSAPISPPTSIRYPPLKPISQPPTLLSVSPFLGTGTLPLQTPQFVEYRSHPQPQPPTSNIIFTQQHREPITEQQYLQFLQPIGSTPQQPIVFDASPPRAVNLFSSLDNTGNTLAYVPQSQPPPQTNVGYRVVVHREQNTLQTPPQSIPQSPREEIITQENIADEPELRTEQTYEPIRRPQSLQSFTPPPLQTLSPPSTPSISPISYRPLPTPPPIPSRQLFEPQVYEPLQQNYEPLQQTHEESTSSNTPPRCECGQQPPAETQAYATKGSSSEAAPVKGSRSSRNVNIFLPQAFRSRRHSGDVQQSSNPGSAQLESDSNRDKSN